MGRWKSYEDETFKVVSVWADGRIPVPDGVDVGDSDFKIAPPYEKHGWKKDGDGNYIDNPEFWWRVK